MGQPLPTGQGLRGPLRGWGVRSVTRGEGRGRGRAQQESQGAWRMWEPGGVGPGAHAWPCRCVSLECTRHHLPTTHTRPPCLWCSPPVHTRPCAPIFAGDTHALVHLPSVHICGLAARPEKETASLPGGVPILPASQALTFHFSLSSLSSPHLGGWIPAPLALP